MRQGRWSRRLAVLPLALALWLVPGPSPAVVMACTCIGQDMQGAAANPEQVVFTGVAQPPEAEGVPVVLTRWFKGQPPDPVVTLDARGFVDPNGGSCGTNAPLSGTEWIFASARNELGRYGVSACGIHAELTTQEGRALLADAVRVLGPGTLDPGIGDPAGPVSPSEIPAELIVAGTLGAAVLVLGLVVLAGVVSRRRGA